MFDNYKICIVGLGYVGLPLAIEFSKNYQVVGFDINENRVKELLSGNDVTLETSKEQLFSVLQLKDNKGLSLTNEIQECKFCDIYIITVPTPITTDSRPDMGPLISASTLVGSILEKGNIVIYESTVYPGATEEICVPILEKESKLKFNHTFFVGYSPERINPGDKIHTLTSIVKVTSGSTSYVADVVDNLYNSILQNGTFKASSIKVAEAAKVIENCQRDINISFMNELALIFDRMGIDTTEVIEAASTKWNFIKLKPGLVGGHCISVDPYYLKWKAEQLGYIPEVISSGRRVNDRMGAFIADKVIKLMIAADFRIKNASILVLGITFKENCPDIRNTKVVDVIEELSAFGCKVDVYDPWADYDRVKLRYDIKLIQNQSNLKKYDAIILAVSHGEFLSMNFDNLKTTSTSVVFDVKGVLSESIITKRL